MKKIIILVLAVISISRLEVNAINTTVTAAKNPTKYEYVSGLKIYKNKAGNSDLFVLDIDNSDFSTTKTYSNAIYADVGIQYIVNSSGNLVYNTQKDYYITQAAILWYMDYLNGNDHNISYTVKRNMENNKTALIKHIIDLVEGAKKYRETDPYVELYNNITFTKSGSYYYSNNIEMNYGGLIGTPTISFSSAPSSTTVYKKELSSDGGYFQIRIPVSSLNNFYKDGFGIYVKGLTPRKKAYIYSNNYENVLYVYNYTGLDNNYEKYLYIDMEDIEYDKTYDTNVRIKVLDDRGNYIKNIKYYIYEGNCEDTTCYSSDLVTNFTTSSSYKTFTTLEPGKYTLVRKTSTSYDLNEKELFTVKNTSSVQTITIYGDDSYYEDDYYEDDYYEEEYKNITIYNSINDASNIIKIYKNNGSLVSSYRSNNNKYKTELKEGKYYIIDTADALDIVYFEVSSSNRLYIIENNQKYEVSYIDLDNYLLRYPSIDDSGNINNTNNNINNNTNNNVTNDYYTDENGTIHIDNLDGVDSIEISQEVKTETSWISNIIDCPITSVSSTIKYIIGAIILATGIVLTIRNVKKQKNNI